MAKEGPGVGQRRQMNVRAADERSVVHFPLPAPWRPIGIEKDLKGFLVVRHEPSPIRAIAAQAQIGDPWIAWSF
jgi:hypothetical protein